MKRKDGEAGRDEVGMAKRPMGRGRSTRLSDRRRAKGPQWLISCRNGLFFNPIRQAMPVAGDGLLPRCLSYSNELFPMTTENLVQSL